MRPKEKRPFAPAVSVRADTYAAIKRRAERNGSSVTKTLELLIVGELAKTELPTANFEREQREGSPSAPPLPS